MHIKTSLIGESTILKEALIWILRKSNVFKKNSNFKCAILFTIAKYSLLH